MCAWLLNLKFGQQLLCGHFVRKLYVIYEIEVRRLRFELLSISSEQIIWIPQNTGELRNKFPKIDSDLMDFPEGIIFLSDILNEYVVEIIGSAYSSSFWKFYGSGTSEFNFVCLKAYLSTQTTYRPAWAETCEYSGIANYWQKPFIILLIDHFNCFANNDNITTKL